MEKQVARNPNVRVFWDFLHEEPPLLIEDMKTRNWYKLNSPQIIEILDEAEPWTSRTALQEYVTTEYNTDTETATTILTEFENQRLLVSRDSNEEFDQTDKTKWSDSGWRAAYDFWKFTRNYPAIDASDHEKTVQERQEMISEMKDKEPIPPYTKTYPNAEETKLSRVVNANFEFEAGVIPATELPTITLNSHEFNVSVRDVFYSENTSNPFTKTRLEQLLDLTFGFKGNIIGAIQGEIPLRTSPSGGSRQPTEVYPVVSDLQDLEPGIHHYHSRKHSLEHLNPSTTVLDRACDVADVEFEPQAALIISSVVKRSMWKYKDSKSLQVIFLDIGHLLCTLQFVANALGLNMTVTRDVDEQYVANELGISLFNEPVFGIVLIGTNH